MKEPIKTYAVNVYCSNCNNTTEIVVPFGETVYSIIDKTKCCFCGCRTLHEESESNQ